MDIEKKFKSVSILGCGWFGLAFAKKLIDSGYEVKGSTTTETKLASLAEHGIKPFLIDFNAEQNLAETTFFESDVLFICIPPKRNSIEVNAYPDKIEAILAAAKGKTAKIVLISSTSVYGDENKVVNEESNALPDTASGKAILAAETLFQNQLPLNFTIIRFAGLIGPNRNPGKFFAGKTDIPNGLAPVNLIHQTDAVGIAFKLITTEKFGRIYNACAPQHPTRIDFYTAAARASNLVEPHFINENNSWKIIESLNVPQFLGYEFEVSI